MVKISLDFYYMDRPLVNKLSATKFVQNIIKTKNRCKRDDCDCKYDRLKYFLPKGLSKDTSLYLINKLQKHYLHY